MKRLVVLSDLHCGHRAGLTPPAYQYSEDGAGRRAGFAKLQRSLWDWYADEVSKLGPVDCLVINGDAIDGKGLKSGGRELITADRDEQIEMAEICARLIKPNRFVIVEGTPYHTGQEESWESVLALNLGCQMDDDPNDHNDASEFGAHIWIDIDGIVFDFRHKVGSSSIPHGRFTAPQRAGLWNILWAEKAIQPNAKFIVRSHVHYFSAAFTSFKTVITTPALQTHSNFGSREVDGTNDIGFLHFDIDNGVANMHTHLYEATDILKAKVLKI